VFTIHDPHERTTTTKQAGFTMLEAGAVRKINESHILLKNILDTCVTGFMWYVVGYSLAFGTVDGADENAFLASPHITPLDRSAHYIRSWAFAAAASTIVSGGIAERCAHSAYLAYAIMLSAWVYPCVAHWCWHPDGWLYKLDTPFHDFAGSSVVHVVGGLTGVIGACAIGPRYRRFKKTYLDLGEDDDDNESGRGCIGSDSWSSAQRNFRWEVDLPYPGQSLTISMLGTFLLWFGWYSLNCGSVVVPVSQDTWFNKDSLVSKAKQRNARLCVFCAFHRVTPLIHSASAHWTCVAFLTSSTNMTFSRVCSQDLMAVVAVTTTLAACVGGITTAILCLYLHGEMKVIDVVNGLLGGLVAITAGADVVEPQWAVVIGVITGIVVHATTQLFTRHAIDDVLCVGAVHGVSGIWGTLATGLFHVSDSDRQAVCTLVLVTFQRALLGAQTSHMFKCLCNAALPFFHFCRISRFQMSYQRCHRLPFTFAG
jgi:Amt family ammonium transporter